MTAVKRVIAKDRKAAKPRPVNPGSDHCYMPPEKLFARYLGAWERVPALEIAGYAQDGAS